eukprot:COSAG05_NODE_1581_length_4493_cov_5.173191_2_plen_89_part_00
MLPIQSSTRSIEEKRPIAAWRFMVHALSRICMEDSSVLKAKFQAVSVIDHVSLIGSRMRLTPGQPLADRWQPPGTMPAPDGGHASGAS